jgi:hypothetical protein
MIRCLAFVILVYICGSIRTGLNGSGWLLEPHLIARLAGVVYRALRIPSMAHHVPGSLGVVTNSGLLIMYFRICFFLQI